MPRLIITQNRELSSRCITYSMHRLTNLVMLMKFSTKPSKANSLYISFCFHQLMRQEHVTLQEVDVSQLYDQIKKYLKDIKLDIIHEGKEDNYWDIKAHKGTLGSVVIGNVRDVEVMISGTQGNYDLVLRTGAWGKDIVVPTAIAGVLTAGVAAIPAAAVSTYRAHSFEKKFWDFIKSTLSEIGNAKATMSEPVVVTH